ncbi:hypothetical protein B296_00013456 [Ensete ventricosum]|uniref:Uncharacterized protein n=1 Tax=Ensete ventricosum TaxID=4639 RepID=A0A426ZYK9_ENSVE|nr:hypothetical protein B296_00013456 [Ensete ventricosum]
MLPLRFPNSGIRAKRTHQGGATRPLVGVADHSQTPYKGSKLARSPGGACENSARTTEAPPLGMASACKGGTCRHNTPRSYRPRRSVAHLPTGAAVPAVRVIVRGQGNRWMRAKGEG